MSFVAFTENDNAITLAGLRDACDDSFANDATVTFTVTDKDGVDVRFDNTSDFWPRPMNYTSGSNGVYCGVLPLEVELVPEQSYIAVIIAVSGGLRGRWNLFFKAKARNVLK